MIQFLLFTALFSSNSINIDNGINSSNEIVEVFEEEYFSSNPFSHGERFVRCLLCGGLTERGFVNYMMVDGTLLYIFIPNNIDDILYYYESKRELFI